MKNSLSLSVLLAVLIAVGGTFGCSPGPEPQELLELERMIQDPEAQQVRESPGASRYFQESRQFRRLAREAHGEKKEELSREYAVQGTLRYRTAVAIASAFEGNQRLEAANAKVEEINPKLKAANDERNKLAQEIIDLEQRVANAVRQRSERERQSGVNFRTNEPTGADAATLRAAATQRIRDAEAAKRSAEAVEAATHATVIFNRAEAQLKTARDLLASHPDSLTTIQQSADNAVMLFEEAVNSAKPRFEEHQRKMQPEARINAIRTMARDNFGGPFTMEEFNGVRVVVAHLFDAQSSEFRSGMDPLLDALLRVAREYTEFSITIEGYTSRRGGATENLATSQVRAHKVRDYLVRGGIDASRISTEGLGQDRIRYPSNVSNNDRVEIILRHTR